MPRSSSRKQLHPLVEAAKKRDFAAVKNLLASGGGDLSRSILQECFVRCVLSRDLKLLDRFLSYGADVDGSWNGYTALSVISEFGNAAFVRALLKRGAGVNVPGYEGAPPLIVCAKMGVEWTDPEIRRHGLTVARTLLAARAKVDTRDIYRKTALDYAFQSGWEQLVRLLFSKGASIAACDERGKMVLLHAVSQPGTTKLLQMYLKNGGSPTLKIGFGTTALEHARRAGWSDKIKLLEKATRR